MEHGVNFEAGRKGFEDFFNRQYVPVALISSGAQDDQLLMWYNLREKVLLPIISKVFEVSQEKHNACTLNLPGVKC